MKRFKPGDRIRIDIPNKHDPDHNRLHQKRGTIIKVIEDDAGEETGDRRDSYLFRVETDEGDIEDLRWRDLRPIQNN